MAEFKCTVCGADFSVHEAALQKYPNWTPRYCRSHSPRRGEESAPKGTRAPGERGRGGSVGRAGELDLTLEEVLQRFSGGPQSGIFTDGSARPNPGPGGWGVVAVRDGDIFEQHHGREEFTTNNRMELTALIAAFKIAPPDEVIEIYTDSDLCVKTITQWAAGWERRGWRRKDGEIKNLDLVQELYGYAKEKPKAVLKWIKAHNGWLWNEYADSLATAWARDGL